MHLPHGLQLRQCSTSLAANTGVRHSASGWCLQFEEISLVSLPAAGDLGNQGGTSRDRGPAEVEGTALRAHMHANGFACMHACISLLSSAHCQFARFDAEDPSLAWV